jgi:cytochrome c
MRRRHALTATFLLLVATAPAAAQQPAAQPDGAQIFTLVCAMCHSVAPPAKAAPPMSHAVAYYLRKHGEAPKAVDALVAYLKEPAAERSAMPAHAIERFGLMPSQAHLGDAQLRAVATYVITLADTAHVRGNHQHSPPPR